MDGGAWWAAVHGVTNSRTRLSDFTFSFSFTFAFTKNTKSRGRHSLTNHYSQGLILVILGSVGLEVLVLKEMLSCQGTEQGFPLNYKL